MFNDPRKYEPEPRDMADQDLLEKTAGYLKEGDSDRGIFLGWLAQFKLKERKGLSPNQRLWVNNVLDRYEPRVANLVSRGLVPRGREVETPLVLRELPKRPPSRLPPSNRDEEE